MEHDRALLLRHLRHYYVDAREHVVCDDTCRREYVCYLRSCAYDLYYSCVNDYDIQRSSATVTASSGPRDVVGPTLSVVLTLKSLLVIFVSAVAMVSVVVMTSSRRHQD